MRRIGIFNIVYGALGLASALYLHTAPGLAVCLWTMATGVVLALRLPSRLARRLFALAPHGMRNRRR